MISVLIAEDDPAMQKILKLYFEREGFNTDTAADGAEALEKLEKSAYDLAILDWMMPGADGPEICRTIKAWRLPVKTILLTAKGQAADEIQGFESGADDYVRKPFEPQVLLIRAKKLVKSAGTLSCGNLRLELESQRIFQNNHALALNKKEYELLALFIRNPGMILPRGLLLDRIWGMDYEGDDRTVDTHIKRLRSKIGKDRIKTHRGLGYSLECGDE